MKKEIFYLPFLCLSLLATPLLSQYDMASSNLRYNLEQVKPKKVAADLPANQDKSNLKMGTRICINVDGAATKAMVTGSGLLYGPNRDSYNVSITEGPKKRQTVYLKPNEITSVGGCAEDYYPEPSDELPPSIDVRQLELAIIKEINIVRTNPRAYADEMAKLQFKEFGKKDSPWMYVAIGTDPMWNCNPTNQQCMTNYTKKLKVAIDYLRKLKGPLSTVTENTNLSKACALLAADKGKIDGPGHKDSKGRDPWKRAEVAGYQNGVRGECLNAGHHTAAGFVVSFLTSPGHRDILMKTDVNEIGVDLHQHGSGKDAFLRDVVIMGKDDNKPVNPTTSTPTTTTPTTSNPTTITTTTPVATNPGTNPGGTGCKGVSKYKVIATSEMDKGTQMYKGSCVISNNKAYALVVTADKLLIAKVDRTYHLKAQLYAEVCLQDEQWAPGYLANWGVKDNKSILRFQADCNLCFSNEANRSWCATTGRDKNVGLLHKCHKAKLTDDGRLVLLNKDGLELWASRPNQTACQGSLTYAVQAVSEIKKGFEMYKGSCVVSQNKQYALVMTSEKLMIAKVSRTFEQKGQLYAEVCTQESSWSPSYLANWGVKDNKSILRFQADCNLCFSNEANRSWCATTGRDKNVGLLHKCNAVKLTNDGRLVLLSKNGKELWSNNLDKK